MNLGSFVFMFFKNMDAENGHQYDHCFSRVTVFSLGGGGGTPYNGLMMGRLRPKGVPFSGFQVHERVGISPVTVYENVGKSVLSVCNWPKMANRCIL